MHSNAMPSEAIGHTATNGLAEANGQAAEAEPTAERPTARPGRMTWPR